MNGFIQIFVILIGLIVFLFSSLFALRSFSSYEIRAGWLGLAGVFFGVVLLFASFLGMQIITILAGLLMGFAIAGLLIFFLPVKQPDHPNQRPTSQVDERTIMFARNRLQPGTPRYEEYYLVHPEHKDIDDTIRNLPGLLSLKTPMADPMAFAATEAGFFLAESLKDAVDGLVASEPQKVSPEFASKYIKHLANYFGAHKSGIAEVKEYQVYSHIGRGSGIYGDQIIFDHTFVVAFTFEMSEEMIRTAPRAQASMETARQYSEAAQTAIQLAAWIRAMGYPARAHIDGNYRLILPLVARDAGLGEIGRMGLLMTPDLGPRVRISAVSTTLPLIPDQPGDDPAMLDFCTICKKCAENCPSQAIPLGDRQEIDGAFRWKVDPEKCFTYWNIVGTDCGRCMMVCPYSHRRDMIHNLMRYMIARSGTARRFALHLDDWVYLRKPKSRPGPGWTRNFQ